MYEREMRKLISKKTKAAKETNKKTLWKLFIPFLKNK